MADFVNSNYKGQETGPGLVFVERYIHHGSGRGGLFKGLEQHSPATHRRFISMDEFEVTNVDYREYLYWLRRVLTLVIIQRGKALPDTLVWRDKMGYNEVFVENYSTSRS